MIYYSILKKITNTNYTHSRNKILSIKHSIKLGKNTTKLLHQAPLMAPGWRLELFNSFRIIEKMRKIAIINSYKVKKSLLYEGLILIVASWKGFEPLTVRLEGACSIQLSYQDNTSIITNYFLFSRIG